MQFINLKSRHQLLGDKIHARIQKVMEHGQFILGPEVRELEEKLGYSRNKSARYSVGPKPTSFGGLRALDFVLDNQTLRDFNRTLLFDIRLSAQR